MVRKILLLLFMLIPYVASFAQYTDSQIDRIVADVGLDSLDQEKIPRIVTMGVVAAGNVSNFLISTRQDGKLKTASSYLRVGVELGGLMDFLVTPYFAIQTRLVFTIEQNHFALGDSANHLWSFGVDVPVIFMYRVGTIHKGYWSVGGGVFAHFTFASDKGDIYSNIENASFDPYVSKKPFYFKLHDNHAGLIAHFNYEFPFGMQIGANYLISLSDIFGYYKNSKGTNYNDVAFYPQRISVGIAYRWK